jgi:hypothetical protein
MVEVTIIATVLSHSVNQIFDKDCSWQLTGHMVQQRQLLLALFIQAGSLAFIVGTDHRVKQHLTKCSLKFYTQKVCCFGPMSPSWLSITTFRVTSASAAVERPRNIYAPAKGNRSAVYRFWIRRCGGVEQQMATRKHGNQRV